MKSISLFFLIFIQFSFGQSIFCSIEKGLISYYKGVGNLNDSLISVTVNSHLDLLERIQLQIRGKSSYDLSNSDSLYIIWGSSQESGENVGIIWNNDIKIKFNEEFKYVNGKIEDYKLKTYIKSKTIDYKENLLWLAQFDTLTSYIESHQFEKMNNRPTELIVMSHMSYLIFTCEKSNDLYNIKIYLLDNQWH